MTQEEVAILWKDANGWDVKGYETTLKDLERFAKLVAAKATAVEREACAKVCESHGTWDNTETIAKAIRARGQQ
jgi:hypothetical protein